MAGPVLAQLDDATDDPLDPALFLVERLIAQLPPGSATDAVRALAPLAAAYVMGELDTIAPRLAPGLRAIAGALRRTARDMTLVERWQLADRGATRAVTGLALGDDAHVRAFADRGVADPEIAIDAREVGSTLVIDAHDLALPYGSMLALALDDAAPPGGLPALVDCDKLATTVTSALGIAAPSIVRAACVAAIDTLASDLVHELAALDQAPAALQVSGSATFTSFGGAAITSGIWSGALAEQRLQVGAFASE